MTDFFSPSVIATIGVGILSGLISIQLFFVKSIGDKFDKLGTAIREVNNITQEWLKDHEEKDQTRHIDNLYRFEKIAVALARMGVDNGTHE